MLLLIEIEQNKQSVVRNINVLKLLHSLLQQYRDDSEMQTTIVSLLLHLLTLTPNTKLPAERQLKGRKNAIRRFDFETPLQQLQICIILEREARSDLKSLLKLLRA